MTGMRGASQARMLVRPLLRSWYRLVALGADHVPAQGPVIVASNHVGILDGPLLLAATPRPVRIMAGQEAFAPPLDGIMTKAGLIGMRPGVAPYAALSQATDTLAADGGVALFPEGRRGNGRVASISHIVALLALRTGAPVVPAAIVGTRRDGMDADALPRRRSRVAVMFGEPFSVRTDSDNLRRTVITGAGEAIRQRLADVAADVELATAIRLPDHAPADPRSSRERDNEEARR